MDDEDSFMYDNEEDFYLEGEDEEEEEYEESEQDNVLEKCEGTYYKAKGLRESDPQQAIHLFRLVVDTEAERQKGEWGFRALKQMTKQCLRQRKHQEALEHYKEVLAYARSAVQRDYGEGSINKMLDRISDLNIELVKKFYRVTLDALEEANNVRMLLKTNLKLGRLYLDQGKYDELKEVIKDVNDTFASEALESSLFSSQLYEAYALELQMYVTEGEVGKMKGAYKKVRNVATGVLHPRIRGVINECGGRVRMSEKRWAEARTEFYEALKNFDNAADNVSRIRTLKYLIITCLLDETGIDPTTYPEVVPYWKLPEFELFRNLVEAYQDRDIRRSERIVKDYEAEISSDPLIAQHINGVLMVVRTNLLLQLIRPYTSVSLDFLVENLMISRRDVEHTIARMILEGKIRGVIDQPANRLILIEQSSLEAIQSQAFKDWADCLEKLYTSTFQSLR